MNGWQFETPKVNLEFGEYFLVALFIYARSTIIQASCSLGNLLSATHIQPRNHGIPHTMAAPQNSLLSRMRSARVPAANLKAPSRSLHASQAHPSPASSSTSNVALFLTNLRLLDLDLLPDWPDINPVTFASLDAAHGQKKRIQCVEWALYQLFSLWDPDETRNVSVQATLSCDVL